jgi:hypothetical protein
MFPVRYGLNSYNSVFKGLTFLSVPPQVQRQMVGQLNDELERIWKEAAVA